MTRGRRPPASDPSASEPRLGAPPPSGTLKPLRIAHLSDLHLTSSDAAARSEPRLWGRLAGMNAAFRGLLRSEHVRRADLLLVTGDVTDRGELGSWEVFWEALASCGRTTLSAMAAKS